MHKLAHALHGLRHSTLHMNASHAGRVVLSPEGELCNARMTTFLHGAHTYSMRVLMPQTHTDALCGMARSSPGVRASHSAGPPSSRLCTVSSTAAVRSLLLPAAGTCPRPGGEGLLVQLQGPAWLAAKGSMLGPIAATAVFSWSTRERNADRLPALRWLCKDQRSMVK